MATYYSYFYNIQTGAMQSSREGLDAIDPTTLPEGVGVLEFQERQDIMDKFYYDGVLHDTPKQ